MRQARRRPVLRQRSWAGSAPWVAIVASTLLEADGLSFCALPSGSSIWAAPRFRRSTSIALSGSFAVMDVAAPESSTAALMASLVYLMLVVIPRNRA